MCETFIRHLISVPGKVQKKMFEIKELDKLLKPELGDKVIVSHETKNLVAPGENYGSLILLLDVKVKNKKTEEEEDLHYVAKMSPPSEFIRKFFNTPVTFKKEVGFYNSIVPEMQKFQKERGCKVGYTFFPKYCGSRISLDPKSDVVDENCCLILENLRPKGFGMEDRMKGFNLQCAEFIIKDLAMFHAVPIAAKISNPDIFDEKVKPYLVQYLEPDTYSEEILNDICGFLFQSISKNEECIKYKDRLKKLIDRSLCTLKYETREGREQFNTIIHNDLWVNNTMLKLDQNGNPIANVIVDFQITLYGSLANDLVFFIFSSLSVEIIDKYYKDLIDLYYNTFIKILEDLKIDTSIFTYEAFLDEIDQCAKNYECFHVLFMFKPIFTDKNKAVEHSELSQDELNKTDTLTEEYYIKLWSTLKQFSDRKWL